MKTEIIIVNKNAFCLYLNRSIGIAYGETAGCVFSLIGGENYITEVTSKTFGWYNKKGRYKIRNKRSFSRPTVEQIISALNRYPKLKELAQSMFLIEERVKVESFVGPKPDKIWMN